MKKIRIFALTVALVIGLFALAGCGEPSSKNGSGTAVQSASANGDEAAANRVISHTVPLNGGEIIYSVGVDPDNKLKYYSQKNIFRPSSKKTYEEACQEYAEIVESENAEGYDFRTSEFERDDDKMEAVIIRKWDVEKNKEGKDIANTLKFVKDDGTFDVEGWEAQFDALEGNH